MTRNDTFGLARLHSFRPRIGTAVALSSALAAVLIAAAPASAATPAALCAAAKLKATGTKGSKKLGCHATAVKKDVAVDLLCLTKAETGFDLAFAKAEAKGGCFTIGDAATIEGTVDGFVSNVVTLTAANADKDSRACAATKRKAAAKKLAKKLKCRGTAFKKGTAVDPTCLERAEAAFAKAYQKADDKGGCVNTGNAATVEAVVDAFVDAFVTALAPPPEPTPTATPNGAPTATPTPNGTPTATPAPGCPEPNAVACCYIHPAACIELHGDGQYMSQAEQECEDSSGTFTPGPCHDGICAGASPDSCDKFFPSQDPAVLSCCSYGNEDEAPYTCSLHRTCLNLSYATQVIEACTAHDGSFVWPGDCFIPRTRLVFITSSTVGPTAVAAGGGDTICNTLATNAGLPGTYKAWISDASGSPSTTFTHDGGPFRFVNGTPFVLNWSDLTDGTLGLPINVDENGNTVPHLTVWDVWTGTSFNGTAVGANCDNWTNPNGTATFGRSDKSDYQWSQYPSAPQPCSTFPMEHLYCFQQ